MRDALLELCCSAFVTQITFNIQPQATEGALVARRLTTSRSGVGGHRAAGVQTYPLPLPVNGRVGRNSEL